MARKLIEVNGQWIETPTGVQVKEDTVRIWFTLEGVRFWEAMYRVVSAENIKKAGIKRQAIMMEIKEGRFDYRRHFPDSDNCLKAEGFKGGEGARMNLTIGQALELDAKRARGEMLDEQGKAIIDHVKSAKNRSVESGRAKRVLAYFKSGTPVKSIRLEQVEGFIRHMQKAGLAPKTINNTLVLVRAVLRDAYLKAVITSPLHDRIRNVPKKRGNSAKLHNATKKPKIRPLLLNELMAIESLAANNPKWQPLTNMVVFACWSGLSMSELLAVAWEDLDTSVTPWRLTVKRARVVNEWRVTKEDIRERTIELNQKATEALKAQRSFTQLHKPITVDVTQRDNVTTLQATFKPIFKHPQLNDCWKPVTYDKQFRKLLTAAEVETRGPNQCRHTFASRMLTNGVPIHYLVQHMGHIDETMIRQHYSEWLDSEVRGQSAEAQNKAIESLL